jgi:hypothetical protein
MTSSSGIQVILRLLPEQFERPQCWYYGRDGFMKLVFEVASDGMTYIQSFIKIDSGIHVIARLLQQ